MHIVIDTNILVSSLWSKNGASAKIMSMVLGEILTPCYDYRILNEYREVLTRPKFGFSKSEINDLLEWIEIYGKSIVATPLNIDFIDEKDKKFYEVEKYCNAKLITGNLKHFPKDEDVMSVIDFLEKYNL
ncbi:MAG: putative toxin-antitoxin system toxin component, PIN family [Clostridia bacterium]|nr:putative toxin-antitoxin system toxin component, PIN family [Clostridia bacterium]